MNFRPTYNEVFPSLESMYHTEKDAIESFCNETGVICAWENDCLEISNQPENWVIKQSLIDGEVLLYHKSTQNTPQHHKTFYEKIDGYHLQDMYFISFLFYIPSAIFIYIDSVFCANISHLKTCLWLCRNSFNSTRRNEQEFLKRHANINVIFYLRHENKLLNKTKPMQLRLYWTPWKKILHCYLFLILNNKKLLKKKRILYRYCRNIYLCKNIKYFMEVLQMARKANYDEKIKVIEEKIEKKSAEIKALKAQLGELKTKKSQDDYQELMEYMKANNLSAGEVLSKIK